MTYVYVHTVYTLYSRFAYLVLVVHGTCTSFLPRTPLTPSENMVELLREFLFCDGVWVNQHFFKYCHKKRNMEISITSGSGVDLSSRISLEPSPEKDALSASEPNIQWDFSMHKEKQLSTSNGPSSADFLYPTEPDLPRPRSRVRYQRRNSAVASTLFPAASLASRNCPLLRSSDGNDEYLHLSSKGIRHIELTQALQKAQDLVHLSTSDSPRPSHRDEAVGKMLKRASLPWSQKYQEEASPHHGATASGSDMTEEGTRKRQKT